MKALPTIDFLIWVRSSWTYQKLTPDEVERLNEVITQTTMSIKYRRANYSDRASLLDNTYKAFLADCGYTGGPHWRSRYRIMSYTAEVKDPCPGCTLGADPEIVAEFDDLKKAKNAFQKMKTVIEGTMVREYWLYEVAVNGDLSSLDSSDWNTEDAIE